MLDPGLYSDAYSDEPYLYGPALSGLFTLNIGEKVQHVSAEDQLAALETETGGVVEEGATGSGKAVREQLNMPSKWKKRRKHFLNAQALRDFTFEEGRMYHADFFNPHLDFANFSLRLPGFSISVAKYIDEKTHHLRYVLKNRSSGEVLFVVFFKLLFGDELRRVEGEARADVEQEKETRRVERTEIAPPVEERRQVARESRKESETETVGTEKPSAQADVKEESEDEESSYSATGAVTSLSNSIYAAFVAMGLWDDNSSSSDDEEPGRKSVPQPTGQALDTKVDNMDDATVEKYLQSRQGNAG